MRSRSPRELAGRFAVSIVVEGKISRSVHVARSLNCGGTLNLATGVITIQKTPGRTDGFLLRPQSFCFTEGTVKRIGPEQLCPNDEGVHVHPILTRDLPS